MAKQFHHKPVFLRPLAHAGDECGCWDCDKVRQDNAMARASINWPQDYPPKFYERVDVDYYRQWEG